MEAILKRTGASIMGKRMFEEGERNWPEEAPFHTPVFVLTKEVRNPWERKGGTTFHFVNDGIESALRQARDVARGKDIRIAGGAHLVRQYLPVVAPATNATFPSRFIPQSPRAASFRRVLRGVPAHALPFFLRNSAIRDGAGGRRANGLAQLLEAPASIGRQRRKVGSHLQAGPLGVIPR